MAAAMAVLFGGGTLVVLALIRQLEATVKGEPPVTSESPTTRTPHSLSPAGCTCRGQKVQQLS
jgi:hypothetical protein